jgi:restriction endonuclease S subunit
MNRDELEGFPIPVPPLKVQRQFVDMVNEKLTRIADLRKELEELQAQAFRDVEEMVLGVRPVL